MLLALQQYYILIFIIFIQVLFIKKVGKGPILLLIALELWFLSAFRAWTVGNDTGNYVGAFVNLYAPFADVFGSSYMEQGYQLFNKFIALFSNNPQAILVATSAVIIGARFLTISRYAVFAGFTALLFVILQFGTTLSMIRQEMAFAIVLLFLPFIVERKLIPFLIGCFLASTFHSSVIAVLPMYWLYQLPWKKKYILIILLGGGFALFALAPILNIVFDTIGRYQRYTGSRLLGEETKVASLVKALVAGSVLSFDAITYHNYKNKLDSLSSPLKIHFLLFMALVGFVFQIVSIRGTVLERIAFYYNFFNIISLPIFIRTYNQKKQVLLILLIIGGFILENSIIFIFRPDWNHWLPYSFCF